MDKRYEVIMDYSFQHFEMSVNHFIEKGYQPIGGIAVIVMKLNEDMEFDPNGNEKVVYHQALYK